MDFERTLRNVMSKGNKLINNRSCQENDTLLKSTGKQRVKVPAGGAISCTRAIQENIPHKIFEFGPFSLLRL